MKKLLLALVLFFGVVMTAAPAFAANGPAATYGGHRDARGIFSYGYYCPFGYRLVYGPYAAVGYYWNGFAYVYGAYTTVGYYCVYP